MCENYAIRRRLRRLELKNEHTDIRLTKQMMFRWLCKKEEHKHKKKKKNQNKKKNKKKKKHNST